MYTFLLVLLVLDSLVLIAAILLQSGKGNGLAASFGGVTWGAEPLPPQVTNVAARNNTDIVLARKSWRIIPLQSDY